MKTSLRFHPSFRKIVPPLITISFLAFSMVIITIGVYAVKDNHRQESSISAAFTGWPKDFADIDSQGAVFADLTGDGRPEIIITGVDWVTGTRNNVVKAYSFDGQLLWTFRRIDSEYFTDAAGNSTLAVGNIDGDSQPEVVVTSRNLYLSGQLYVLGSNGQIKWQTHIDPNGNEGRFWTVPVLADADRNGVSEIIVGYANILRAYVGTGRILWERAFATDYPYLTNPVVGNVDNSGGYEIAVGRWGGGASTSQVVLVNASNGSIYGSALNLPGQVRQNLALADVDGNVDLEMVFSTFFQQKTYIYNHNGTILNSSWPKSHWGFKALADLEGNNDLETVVIGNDSKLYAWNRSGTLLSGWPLSPPVSSGIQQLVVGDIDADNQPEVIYIGRCSIYAYEKTGAMVSGYPIALGSGCASNSEVRHVLLGSYNGTVYLLALINSGAGYKSTYLINLQKQSTPKTNDWPMYLRNNVRNSLYTFPVPGPVLNLNCTCNYSIDQVVCSWSPTANASTYSINIINNTNGSVYGTTTSATTYSVGPIWPRPSNWEANIYGRNAIGVAGPSIRKTWTCS